VVEHAGFKSIQRPGIVLHVNDNIRLDYSLVLGEVSQMVDVHEDVPLLRTTDASLGQVVDNQKVTSPPLNGRSSFRLVELTPATFPLPAPPASSAIFPSIPPGTRTSPSTAVKAIQTRS
jgi:hypothetical protein